MLRRIVRLFVYLLAVVVLAVAGGFSYLFLAFPRAAPPAIFTYLQTIPAVRHAVAH